MAKQHLENYSKNEAIRDLTNMIKPICKLNSALMTSNKELDNVTKESIIYLRNLLYCVYNTEIGKLNSDNDTLFNFNKTKELKTLRDTTKVNNNYDF